MRESLQLAAALAPRRGRSLAGADWRPLLRYAAGNPLTITVLVGQALRGNLTTTESIENFALGRTRSLAASLSYGFAQAFTEAERAQLAVLHLFRDTADVVILCGMGDPEAAGEDAVPELAGLNREAGIALLDRAADIGLLAPLGGGYYQIHPALPWYFTALYTSSYGSPASPAAQRAARAYTPDFINPETGGALPGREDVWHIVTNFRVRLAIDRRDWPTATALQNALIAWNRDLAAAALDAPPASLTARQRTEIFNLGAALTDLGDILMAQDDPGCLPHYQEGLALDQKIGRRAAEAKDAFALGTAYLAVPGLRDLGQAEHWYQRSLSLRADSDQLGRARSLGQLGSVAVERFYDARAAGAAESMLLQHLDTALQRYQQALDLVPIGDHETRATIENALGGIYARAGDTGRALRHYQQSLQHHEARGDISGAGSTRYNIALLLEEADRAGDALLYARAALDNFQQAGPGAAANAAAAERLIAELENPGH